VKIDFFAMKLAKSRGCESKKNSEKLQPQLTEKTEKILKKK
jgi:hypothetical protein